VQFVDDGALLRLAEEHDLLVKIVHRPGHFVMQGEPLALAGPAERAGEIVEALRETIPIGGQQTPLQDVEFSTDQLVEVAVRALSPGINDPFTAIACINHLGAALRRLAGRKIPSPYRTDKQGRLRVIAYSVNFEDVADSAFRQIRQYGRSSPAVLVRLLEVIAEVAPHAKRPEDREALLHDAAVIHQAASALPEEFDRQDVEERYQRVLEVVRERQTLAAPRG
jgi:uncharacterized membrane protein